MLTYTVYSPGECRQEYIGLYSVKRETLRKPPVHNYAPDLGILPKPNCSQIKSTRMERSDGTSTADFQFSNREKNSSSVIGKSSSGAIPNFNASSSISSRYPVQLPCDAAVVLPLKRIPRPARNRCESLENVNSSVLTRLMAMLPYQLLNHIVRKLIGLRAIWDLNAHNLEHDATEALFDLFSRPPPLRRRQASR